MKLDWSNLAAFIGMAIATYACRGGGYWLFRQIRPTPQVRSVLTFIPGTLFVSYVAPALVSGGSQPIAGAIATATIMIVTRNLLAAIVGGMGAAWLVYTFK